MVKKTKKKCNNNVNNKDTSTVYYGQISKYLEQMFYFVKSPSILY